MLAFLLQQIIITGRRAGIRLEETRKKEDTKMQKGEQKMRMVLRPKELAASLGIARSTLHSWVKSSEDFPKPVRLGPRALGWRVHDVIAWLERRKETKHD
jgi:prophage regulatory protein